MYTTYCNPLDLGYRYSHMNGEQKRSHREGADPTMVFFKGIYYLFVSMSAGFWYSRDLLNWQFHPDAQLLIYDYAPDVRQIGDALYFCASRGDSNCPILRTEDPLTKPFTQVSAPFPFWDPDLFQDDDGSVYLYWGCTNTQPIWGIRMDPKTMTPIGSKVPLIYGRETSLGYERPGENGFVDKAQNSLYRRLAPLYHADSGTIRFPEGMQKMDGCSEEIMTARFLSIGRPYIEGPFMTKHDGKYYLQYACPGTEFNTYSDGVYVGSSPLGPFTLQKSNPFSSKPGGFITAAGHGSTIADRYGNYWHASTMRISVNHMFERRVGLFPAGFDKDGILYCNQNFSDYPHEIPSERFDSASQMPKWMLLSYRKPVTASSGENPQFAVNENIRDWWSAEKDDPTPWLCVDLEKAEDLRAIQVSFADEDLSPDFPEKAYHDGRKIELTPQYTSFILEYSTDGIVWQPLETVCRECVNCYLEYPDGIQVRMIRLTVNSLPYGQTARVSGLRLFGNGSGEKCPPANADARRINDLEAKVTWEKIPNALGCNVRYGIAPDKLYLSWLVYDAEEVTLTTLIQGQEYYACVDSFNENGITPGRVIPIR